jgi:DNA ligase 1
MTTPLPMPTRRRVLAALSAVLSPWPLPVLARDASAAPALLLAQEAPADIDPAGYLVSEKYDGVRAVWDGQVLRFRSGAAIAVPAWFTARLPPEPLDGELWLGRARFEALSATVRRLQPDDAEWRLVRYMVFEAPQAPGDFTQRAAHIEAVARRVGWPTLVAVAHRPVADQAALQAMLKAVVDAGGEGLVLHRADAPYRTGRSADLQKLKPLHDAEAQVIAHVPGRGKHTGRLGALRVRTPEGIEFSIGTGFSDAERAAPPPIGATVSYTHRGRTAGEVPRFASFLRVREI